MNIHILRIMGKISNYNYESLIQLFFLFLIQNGLIALPSILQYISCEKTVLFITESLSTKLCSN